MNNWQKAAYASIRARRHNFVDRPCRLQHMLRQAIERVGLRVLEYYHEVQIPGIEFPVYFNAAVQLGAKVGYIDLNRDQRVPRRKRIRQIKRDYCYENQVPYLEISPRQMRGADEVQLLIEQWRLTWIRRTAIPTAN